MISFLSMSVTAAIIHTLLGLDHYLPFVVLSKVRGWSYRKTLRITFACGLGHILSAVILGYFTLQMGFSLEKLNLIESVQSYLFGWALLIFGLVYLTWGLCLTFRKNIDITSSEQTGLLPWVLFIIFILGPCEPLIPIIMYPALRQDTPLVFWATGLFGAATIAAMLAVVTVSYGGLNMLAFRRWGRFSHAVAGMVIALCGVGVRFLGL